MSEASAHKLAFVVEATRGTTPANPVFQRLPDTRTTLGLNKENLPSERLTGDRFPAEPRTGASLVTGDIPADLSREVYDEFISSALQGAWVLDVCLAGSTRKSFSFLREFSDFEAGKERFLLYSGCEVSSWNLTADANALAKSTFSFFGRNMAAPSLTAPAGTTYTAAVETEPFDTFSGELKIDGVESLIVTSYNITINNGHAAKFVVGHPTSQDPMVSQSVIEGSLTAYFENADLYTKFIDEESMSLELTLQDSEGYGFIILLPNLKIGAGTQPDVTADGSITIPINFTAHKDAGLGSHISVERFEPAP